MIAHRYRSVTAYYSQRRKWVLILTLALGAVLVLGAGFYLGQSAAYNGMGIDTESYRDMQLELPRTQEELTAVRGELDIERTRHEMDRRALEMVRQELASQKERIADQEEGLRFYKSLMAPEEIANGLSLRMIELIATEQPQRFAFRIVVQQEARKHELLKGELYAEVSGVLDENPMTYPLSQLSDDLDDGVLALRFRYFQAIEGELVLPEGFEPTGVSVVATASKPRKAEAREQYPWQLQERFTHVGK